MIKVIGIGAMVGILYTAIIYLFKRYEKNKFEFDQRILALEIRVAMLENKKKVKKWDTY